MNVPYREYWYEKFKFVTGTKYRSKRMILREKKKKQVNEGAIIPSRIFE